MFNSLRFRLSVCCPLHIPYTPSISLDRVLKFIAMRTIIPHWLHILFLYIMNSLVFATFLLFLDNKTVKNRGHGLLGFYISNLSYTGTISKTRGPSILARINAHDIKFRHFIVEYFNLWTSSVLWIISICGKHVSKNTRSGLVPILRNVLIYTIKPNAVF